MAEDVGPEQPRALESDELVLFGLPGDSHAPFPVLIGSSPHSCEAAAAPPAGGVKTQACGHLRSQEPLEMGRHSRHPGDCGERRTFNPGAAGLPRARGGTRSLCVAGCGTWRFRP